jgi:hypothetical protein
MFRTMSSMRARATTSLCGLPLFVALGWASTPKPKEIVALQDLRSVHGTENARFELSILHGTE